jgi:aspartyl-tRNA(Asn)/glutamyl-tRNA(Gln) amidotransferase subunit C
VEEPVAISRDEVHRIAKLANLDFTDEEYDRFTSQLSAILDHVATLDRLATYGIEPTAQVVGTVHTLRGDEVGGSIPQEEALANAPESEQGLFKVPKVIG